VQDFHFENLHKAVEPMAIHFSHQGGLFSLRVDSKQLSAAIQHLESTWENFAPSIPLEYRFLDDAVAQQYGAEQTTQRLFLVLAALSLFIACLGLFGLATHLAQQRTKEIGIRKVLGASAASIVGLLSQDFIRLILIAILVAAPLAYWAMNQWLSGFAYRIHVPWWVFAVAGVLAILVAFFTIASQALRAALSNPVKSLRSE
jgi:putative ABC transport system permease protein